MTGSTTLKITQYELNDVVRGKGIIGYALFFAIIAEALIRFSGGPKALLSLSNVVLIVIPLVCLLFGAIYLYNARNFVEMMLVQPISRRQMFGGLYLGLSLPLALGYALGIAIPFMMHAGQWAGYGGALTMLLVCGIFLSFLYTSIAFLIVTYQEDKARGLSAAFMVWFFTSVIYDGLVLLLVHGLRDYSLETPTLIMTMLNPTDLARVLLMLHFDIAAMMGYTGAVFEAFFEGTLGIMLILSCLTLWVAIPLGIAYRRFLRMDF